MKSQQCVMPNWNLVCFKGSVNIQPDAVLWLRLNNNCNVTIICKYTTNINVTIIFTHHDTNSSKMCKTSFFALNFVLNEKQWSLLHPQVMVGKQEAQNKRFLVQPITNNFPVLLYNDNIFISSSCYTSCNTYFRCY